MENILSLCLLYIGTKENYPVRGYNMISWYMQYWYGIEGLYMMYARNLLSNLWVNILFNSKSHKMVIHFLKTNNFTWLWTLVFVSINKTSFLMWHI